MISPNEISSIGTTVISACDTKRNKTSIISFSTFEASGRVLTSLDITHMNSKGVLASTCIYYAPSYNTPRNIEARRTSI
jgi:hypothetical protein